jgi:hypothetical protein
MSSIRSILIKTSVTNIQKELSQLEHWLNNLPDAPISSPNFSPDLSSIHSSDGHGLSNIYRMLDKLSEELGDQRNTLNNILERIDNLEGFGHPNREVFIDEHNKRQTIIRDPWLDDTCEPLRNEIVEDDLSDEDNIYVSVYPLKVNVEEEEEEEVEAEEEEEEEEEDEGMEIEEIEYKETRYYKDAENFIYSINKDDEPSENLVGYWKEKTQSIAFYKTK